MPPNKKNQNNHHNGNHGHGTKAIKCCVPTECFSPGKLIYLEDLGTSDYEVVKVVCNNDHCSEDEYMHKDCFEAWEQTVLTYLRSCGRARSWSEKQRLQNLWTKRGYDLAFKACSCKCAKGHLRKDLNWFAPARTIVAAAPLQQQQQQAAAAVHVPAEEHYAGGIAIPEGGKKKKKSKNKELRPTLAISAPVPHPNNNSVKHHPHNSVSSEHRGSLVGSQSSSFDSSSGSPNTSSVVSLTMRPRINSVSSNESGLSGSPPNGEHNFGSPAMSMMSQNALRLRKNSKGSDILGLERRRNDSGGLFSRRMDFSSFNGLPRYKLNSYQIKMEEDGGNDSTRDFILSTLLATKTSRVCCVLCSTNLIIFDRYPLIDGTFFLSPRQHTKNSIEAPQEGRSPQYLSAICMGCLEGWSVKLACRNCRTHWNGFDLVLGTCYSYDVFAATPCCSQRFTCLNCKSMVLNPDLERPQMYSEYSHSAHCPNCGFLDFHLCKPLPIIFDKMSC